MNFYSRKAIYALVALVMVVLTGFLWKNRLARVEFPKITARTGKLEAGSEVLNLRKAIQYYEDEIRRQPTGNIKNLTTLAQLYMQRSRITGRHHEDIAVAEGLIERALQLDPSNFDAIVQEATLFLSRHQFEKAAQRAQDAISMNRFVADPWGIYSDAMKELGDYRAAVAACDKMLSLRPDLRSYARAAHLRELHGDIRGAKAAMLRAVNSGVIGSETHAWTVYQLGNLYLKEGKVDTAGVLYLRILEGRPDYHFAFQGLAQVEREKGNYGAARNLLLRAYTIAPEHEFLEELIELHRAIREDETADVLLESALASYKQHEEQGWNINLEYAKFCLKYQINEDEALSRMAIEFERRPQHVEVAEVYRTLRERQTRS